MTALVVHTYSIDSKDTLLVAMQGSLYTVGVELPSGEIVNIEMTTEQAHLLWDFLSDTPAGKPCVECSTEVTQ